MYHGWQSAWRRPAIGALLRVSGSGVPGFLHEFSVVESMSPFEVVADQQRRLQRLLRHCHEQVPYYRRILDEANLDTQKSITADDLKKLPILTKDIIRREGSTLLAADHANRKPFDNTSGGSTGKPVVFMQDRKYYEQNVITAKLMFNQYYGKSMGDPEINLWGSVRDVQRGNLSLSGRFTNYLYNRTFQNAFLLDDEKMAKFVDEINRRKPVVIWTYVESIDLMARFIRDNGLRIHGPKLIISTAGTLYDEVRESVQSVFACPVYNQYGSREVGPLAFETQDRRGMRGLPYLHLIEIIDSRIIVTCLTNYTMPLLRYEIGDVAEAWTGPQNEEFGCEKILFKSVTGRIISHFKTATNGIVHGQYFIHVFYFVDWVRQFQVVQNSMNELVCRIVSSRDPVDSDMARITSDIKAVMGPECNVIFDFVDNIAPSESGKFMYTICNI